MLLIRRKLFGNVLDTFNNLDELEKTLLKRRIILNKVKNLKKSAKKVMNNSTNNDGLISKIELR